MIKFEPDLYLIIIYTEVVLNISQWIVVYVKMIQNKSVLM
jgi:hypothetical protein